MARYFIKLSYDGTPFHGWQIQPNAPTVQQELEQAFATIFRKKIAITGCGRTDTGVHATTFFAHFDCDGYTQEEMQKFIPQRINKLLSPAIAIEKLHFVTPQAHSRFDATSRTYHYHINRNKIAIGNQYSTPVHYELNFTHMNSAASQLLNFKDFTSFSKLHSQTKTNNCTISHAQWEQLDSNQYRFTITADRFLRNMVRAIVGTLFEVGRGRITIDQFCKIIEQKERSSAGISVPAQGLFLANVTYPASLFIN